MKKNKREYWLSVMLAFIVGVLFTMYARKMQIASTIINGVIVSEVYKSWAWSK